MCAFSINNMNLKWVCESMRMNDKKKQKIKKVDIDTINTKVIL